MFDYCFMRITNFNGVKYSSSNHALIKQII